MESSETSGKQELKAAPACPPGKSPISILALVLSIGFIMVGPFGSIAGIILGRTALKDARETGDADGARLSKAAIGIGWAGIILSALVVVGALLLGVLIWGRVDRVFDVFVGLI